MKMPTNDRREGMTTKQTKKRSKSSAAAARRAKKKQKRIILFIVEILVLAILVAVLYTVLKADNIQKIKVDEENIVTKVNENVENNESLKGYRNIALFGVDSREGDLGKGTRSDSIIIASINEETGEIKLCSVYRDTYLNLSNDSYNKCNSAYAKGGPEQAIIMLNMNLDLNITDYVTIGFDGLTDVIDALGGVLSSGFDLVIGIFNWFIVLLYVVFIMLDYEKLLHGMRRMVPPKYRAVTFSILDDVKNSMNHYFRGQALVAFIVGICFAIGFLIVGLPLAVILGLFIGLLNMVPYLQLISLIPTTLLCLVYTANSDLGFWEMWWSCMAVYIVVQCFQDLFLTPKIMGKAMGLNPAIILLSLSVWGTLLGFIGLIIALPLTTLLLAYYDRYITHREDGETPDEHREDHKLLKEIIEE